MRVKAVFVSARVTLNCLAVATLFGVLLAPSSAVTTAGATSSVVPASVSDLKVSKTAAGAATPTRRSSKAEASEACTYTSKHQRGSLSSHSEIGTRVEVQPVNDALVGSTETITVHVTAVDSKRVPTGYVQMWDSDLPSIVRFVNSGTHRPTLHNGEATFELREPLPGAPFSVTGASVLYTAKQGSVFESGSTSCPFEIEMDKWPANLSATLGRDDGDGQAAPVTVSISTSGENPPAGETVPAGDLTVSDTYSGGVCEAQVSDAFAYGGSGLADLNIDLPSGANRLSFTYAGDAYFASTQASVTPSDITTSGWSSDTCPATWVTMVPDANTAPLSGADIPLTDYAFPRPYGEYDPDALANPNVGIFVVQMNWSEVESSEGQFNFTPADQEVAAAIAQGKKVALLLRFQDGSILSGSSPNCAWNTHQFLPTWVVTDLGSAGTFCSRGMGMFIPDYWNADFIRLWTDYVEQVAAHFSYDCTNQANQQESICVDTADAYQPSYIAYVRAPVGLDDEGKVISGPNGQVNTTDRKHLTEWGYTPQLWEAWQEDILSYYKQAFSYSPWVLYTINKQYKGLGVNNECTGDAQESILPFQTLTIPCTSRPVEVDVAEWAVDQGFGLAQNSLQPSWILGDPDKADPPAGDVNTIFAYALNHTPRPFIELQPFQALSTWCNLAVKTSLPPCRTNKKALQSAEDDIDYARYHGVTTIEWYDSLCPLKARGCDSVANANDLTNPALQPVFTLWSQLAGIPGTGRIPTMVTMTPAQTTVQAGSELGVTITVSVPGITGFIPGGSIKLSYGFYATPLGRSITIAPDAGTVTTEVKVPKMKAGHIDLTASFGKSFLWLGSTSTISRITVVGG